MRIISVNKPIVDEYSNFNFKNLKEKAQGLVGSGKISGLANTFLNKNQNQPVQKEEPIQMPKQKGMSKGLKTGLIIGGSLLLVGLTVLVIIKTRKK